MCDVNPLGITMHLKELDRQAGPKLEPFRPGSGRPAMVVAFGTGFVAALRLHASGWRAARASWAATPAGGFTGTEER